jgi:Family of unknown function (DUF5995)
MGKLCAAVVAALVFASAARAQDGPPSPNWGRLLAGAPVPSEVQPHGVEHCRRASPACIDDLIARLQSQFTALDAACDHRAVFSLAYLRITEGLRAAIVRGDLRYPRWIEYVIADFSNHYFGFFADYAAGRPVPYSWKVAYDADMHGDTNAGQDTLLASSAHTQHDLPFIYAEMGMATRSGRSRKADHDAVNAINDEVFAGLEDYYARHYDPVFNDFELAPFDLDRIATLQLVQSWREGAWRNGERLMNARSGAERAQIVASIDANADAWADFIAKPQRPGYRKTRDAYCATHR